jgi:hypothetical protein
MGEYGRIVNLLALAWVRLVVHARWTREIGQELKVEDYMGSVQRLVVEAWDHPRTMYDTGIPAG